MGRACFCLSDGAIMSGFFLRNNQGHIAFDSSRGSLPQFIGRYSATSDGWGNLASSIFPCTGLPLVFARNLSVVNGDIVVAGVRRVSVDTWQAVMCGQGTTGVSGGGPTSGEIYVFGQKTLNRPYDQHGFVIKNSTPGGLDFFDARDRILRIECYARTTAMEGQLSPPIVPVSVLGGSIPVNWAVASNFPHGVVWWPVASNASNAFFTSIGRIDATTCNFAGVSSISTGSAGPVHMRGVFRVYAGHSAYFINTDLYQ